MFKIIRISILLGCFLIVVYLSVDSFVAGGNFEPYIYWFLLINLLYLIWQWRKNSRFSLYFSFVLFIMSSIVVTLGFKSVGEFLMRLSLTFLLVGYIQSLIEFKNTQSET